MAPEQSRATISEIVLAAEPENWSRAGFAVKDDGVRIGSITVWLAGADAGRRIVRWVLDGATSTDLDGLPTVAGLVGGVPGPAPAHPNGVARVDHVVAFSPNLSRTVPALEAAGLDLRRVREGPTPAGAERQAFFRLGESILEVVEHPPGTPAAEDRDAPAGFYGLALAVEDLGVAQRRLGALLGEPRDAVQPGRRIATVRRDAGLGLPVAFITA